MKMNSNGLMARVRHWHSRQFNSKCKTKCYELENQKNVYAKMLHTSSLMIKLGRRDGSSGINEPRRLPGPELGANELLRLGLFSRMTSILGASTATAGALMVGTLTDGTS